MDKNTLQLWQEIKGMMAEPQKHNEYKEKVFILREGMIQLAGGFVKAAILQSFVSWTEHWYKADNETYKLAENAMKNNDFRTLKKLKEQIRQGWFWKSAQELSEELLGEISRRTTDRYIKELEDRGLICSRDPEEKSIYRAKWYKANVGKIREELELLGFNMDYYKNTKIEGAIGHRGQCDKSAFSSPHTTVCSENNRNESLKPAVHSIGHGDQPCGQNGQHLLISSFKTDEDEIYIKPENEFEYSEMEECKNIALGFFKTATQEILDIPVQQWEEFLSMARIQGVTVPDMMLKIYFRYPRKNKPIGSLVAMLKSALQEPWKWREDINVTPEEMEKITSGVIDPKSLNDFTFYNWINQKG